MARRWFSIAAAARYHLIQMVPWTAGSRGRVKARVGIVRVLLGLSAAFEQ